ncbi:chromate transporter [Trueperella sp. zg.1013]|nr:chromate transporter [Trueperella sp. zg.1013]MBW9213176.1 chromate transporter [Trueperella sp. zg.1013]
MSKKENFSYMKLFFEMMLISAFTFGGGFVIISMMKKKFCEELHWVGEDEVLDMTAIAQSAPGALAVNSAIIFGYHVAGITGVLLSTLAIIIPPIVIITIVCMIYEAFSTNAVAQTALRVMRAGITAIIIDVVIDLGSLVIHARNRIHIFLMSVAFIAVYFFSIGTITIILLFIILGIAMNFLKGEIS